MKTDPALSPGRDKTLVLIIKYTIDIPNFNLFFFFLDRFQIYIYRLTVKLIPFFTSLNTKKMKSFHHRGFNPK